MSELARMRAHFNSRGWNPADLDNFRMEAGDGSEGGSGDQGGEGSESGDPPGDGGGDLGEAGIAALAAERRNARDAKKALKPWQSIGEEFGLSPDDVRDALAKLNASSDGDQDPPPVDVDKITRDAQRAANDLANARIVQAEVRALAADTFADASDAIPNVDLSAYEVNDDGTVDIEAIKADLADVLKKKPHLAKSGKRPIPDPSQGSRGLGKKESTPGLGRLADAYAARSKTAP